MTPANENLEVVGARTGQITIGLGGDAIFQWDYDSHDEQVLSLYARGKQRQWDADSRLDWSHEPDPEDPLGMPDHFIWIAGSPLWDRLPRADRVLLRRHTAGWMYSQFLHAEQLSLLVVSKVAQTVPTLDAKLFAATQLMDEARHAEAFTRYINTKIGVRYPISAALGSLFEQVTQDQRWDLACIATHVIIENMGLAAFGQQREQFSDPFARALAAYLAQDEARHVAFGRVTLRQYLPGLSAAEIRDREDFALEACWGLRDRFMGKEMFEALGYDTRECLAIASRSATQREFRRRLFMRIVPALRDIGLFGPGMQEGLAKMGVLGFNQIDGERARQRDERAVEELELAARRQQIQATIRLGGCAPEEEAPEEAAP